MIRNVEPKDHKGFSMSGVQDIPLQHLSIEHRDQLLAILTEYARKEWGDEPKLLGIQIEKIHIRFIRGPSPVDPDAPPVVPFVRQPPQPPGANVLGSPKRVEPLPKATQGALPKKYP